MNKEHIPVLLDEVKEGLNIKKNGIYIDSIKGLSYKDIALLKVKNKKIYRTLNDL